MSSLPYMRKLGLDNLRRVPVPLNLNPSSSSTRNGHKCHPDRAKADRLGSHPGLAIPLTFQCLSLLI